MFRGGRAKRLAGALAVWSSLVQTADGAPPPNDLRAQAAALGVAEPTTGTTIGATRESGDAPITPSLSATVWYDWTAAAAMPMELMLGHAKPTGSSASATLYVFRDGGSDALVLTAQGAFSETPTGRVVTRARFQALAGSRYLIAVASPFVGRTSFDLKLEVMTGRNAHDDFANALEFFGATQTVSAARASLEPGEPGTYGKQASVWLRYTATQAGWFSASCSSVCVLDALKGAEVCALTSAIQGVQPRSDTSVISIQPGTLVTFHAAAGEVVYLRILTNIDVNVTVNVKPAIAGDHFADAIDAGSATNFTHTNLLGEMTMEGGEPGALREGFWVRWTAPTSGVFRATTSTPSWERFSGLVETGLNPEVRVFQGVSAAAAGLNVAVPLGIVHQPCHLRATAGQTYYFQAGITPSRLLVSGSASAEEKPAPNAAVGNYGPVELNFLLEPAPTSPPNDDFANAHDFGSSTLASMSGNNICATNEPGEPVASIYSPGDTVWHRWTAPATGRYELVMDDAVGLNLTISSGTAIDALTNVAGVDTTFPNNETPDPPPVRLRWPATQSVVYYLRVAGRGYGGQGPYTLSLRQMSPPVNDMRAAASALPSSHPLNVTGTTVDASSEATIPGDDDYRSPGSVWWNWVAPQSGWFGAKRTTGGVSFEAGVMENGVTMGSSLTQDVPLRFRATAGRTYSIRIGTSIDAEGVVNWRLEREPGFDHATADAALDIGGAGTITTAPFYLPGGKAGYFATGPNSSFIEPGVWYLWTAPSSGWVSFDTQGSQFAASLSVFSSASGSVGSFIGSSENGASIQSLVLPVGTPAPPPVSRVLCLMTAGQPYVVHLAATSLSSAAGAPSGDAVLRIEPALGPPQVVSASVTELTPALATRARQLDALVSVNSPNGLLVGSWSAYGSPVGVAQLIQFDDRHRVSGDAFSGVYRVSFPVSNSLAATLSQPQIAIRDAKGGVVASGSAANFPPLSAWSGDDSAPVLDHLVGLPAVIDLNGTDVTVSLRMAIEDSGGSGFADGAVFFQDNAFSGYVSNAESAREWPVAQFDGSARISGDMHSGVYAVCLVVPAHLSARPAGTLRLRLRDAARNELKTINGSYPSFTNSMPLNCVVTQSGLTDIVPPAVTAGVPMIEAPSMDAPHGRLRVSAQIADALSGFFGGQLELLDVNGVVERSWPVSSADRIAGDDFSGDYLITRALPSFGFGGVHYARLKSNDGSGMAGAVLLGPFNVADRTAADTLAPALTSFSISPSSVDLMSGPATVTCALAVVDDEQGMSGTVAIRDSLGRLITSVLFSTSSASHAETLVLPLPQWPNPGPDTWAEVSVVLTDAGGRVQKYGTADGAAWPAGSAVGLQIAPAPLGLFERLLADYPGLSPTLISDADGDGFGDLVELAFGSDPLTGSGNENSLDARAHRLPLGQVSDNGYGPSFSYSFHPHPGFTRAAPDAFGFEEWRLRVQCSGDLTNWQTITLPDRNPFGFIEVQQALAAPCFFRLTLTPPP